MLCFDVDDAVMQWIRNSDVIGEYVICENKPIKRIEG